MKSIQSIRALRTAASAPPLSSSQRRRQFSSQPATSSRSSLLVSFQNTRSRQGRQESLCLSCQHRLPARRNFSLASFANTTVDVTEATISHLHYVTHTPWYITIPLVALSVNLLFRLPLSVHARNLTQKRAHLNPLLRSWTNIHTEQVLKERQRLRSEQLKRLASPSSIGNEEAPVDISVASVQAEVLKRHVKTSGRIYSRFGVQQWKLYANILALPPWLVVIEAIRRMCGAPVGLLGMIFRKTPTADSAQTEAAITDAAAASPAAAELVDTAATAVSDITPATTAAVSDAISVLSEPSIATGGCLWFPDLTAADPYHVLPFALSAMLVVNILPSSDAGRRMLFGLPSADGSVVTQSAMSRGIQRSLLIMSFSVGFVTMNFPAAIHLYWLSSAGTTYAISRTLRYLKPMPNSDPPLRQHREGPWIIPKAPAATEQ
ncbi:mitochondrial export translocase oxa2 [Ophiostoma piceae UAMH 11346]|uniref:Mitochondrial export translocase oxa2 n=1 Tax=Ophiostoma piceae (strain UAMH 11346) TaxID=1262450 RepID=S3C1W3_OPHP1|nr:mitochondrial export translocase oxa2 [Ophiostoma piceae UAMH 11346]